MKAELVPIIDRVFKYMTKKDVFGRTLNLKAKSSDFQTFTRSKTYLQELKNKEDILRGAYELLEANVADFGKVRLLGISFSNLTREQVLDGIQLELNLIV